MDLRAAKAWALDLLFPTVCLGCGAEGSFLCPACSRDLVFSAPGCPVCAKRNFTGILCERCAETSGLRRFLAPFSYREPLVRELIHAYKYDGVRELAGRFADELARFLAFYAIRPAASSVLVPIPLHRSRERERGFNQSALLADELGRRLNLAVASAVRRSRPTDQQIDMETFAKRRENVADAFRITAADRIKGTTAILVDDVSTSGATLSEAARVLREAGCRTVWAMVIAKG